MKKILSICILLSATIFASDKKNSDRDQYIKERCKDVNNNPGHYPKDLVGYCDKNRDNSSNSSSQKSSNTRTDSRDSRRN